MLKLPARIATTALPLIALLAGCAHPGENTVVAGTRVPSAGCATSEVSIEFDFAGASPARCVVEGPRAFALVVTPEHAPPINPSPWYAFRYVASAGDPVRLRLDYPFGRHRYAPKLVRDGRSEVLSVEVASGGTSATLALPAGAGTVSAQPLVTAGHASRFLDELVRDYRVRRSEIGRSLDGRPIEAVRFGDPAAARLIVILGRQHPPEVTGNDALEPFLRSLAQAFASGDPSTAGYQVLAVPMLNPDGVERGHWRANRGGVDLNRDWGPFTQPETRAVRDTLAGLPGGIRPVLVLDFHSTWKNLFYVQGDEATLGQRKFVADWLGGKEAAFAGYPMTIEPSNANPGSGTSKNWFHATYGIPAITYEVGDDTPQAATAAAARALAGSLLAALEGQKGA